MIASFFLVLIPLPLRFLMRLLTGARSQVPEQGPDTLFRFV